MPSLLVALCCVALVVPGQAQDPVEGGEAAAADGAASDASPWKLSLDIPIHGTLSGRSRWRFDDHDEDDLDLYEYLNLQVGEVGAPGLSASFSGRLSQDLDGKGGPRIFHNFNDILDSYDSWMRGRVYHLFGTYRPDGTFLEKASLGRQYVMAGEVFHLDGGHVVLRPMSDLMNLTVHAFGGVPVHMYENTLYDGDWILGGGVALQPWAGADTRLDYAHIGDENEYYEATDADLFTLQLRQNLAGWIDLWGTYQHLDEDPRTAAVGVEMAPPDVDIHMRFSWRALLSPEKDLAYDLDPFYAIMRNQEPYWDAHMAVGFGLGEYLLIEGGATFRQLFDEDDEGLYNREYNRFYLTAALEELLVPQLSASVTGEIYTATLDDDEAAITADLSYEVNDELTLTLGTDFALWRLDFYSGEEKYDSQGYFLRGDWRPNDRWRFNMSMRLEHDDYETYGILRSGFQFNF